MIEYVSTITIEVPDKGLHDSLIEYLCAIAADHNKNQDVWSWRIMKINDKQEYAPNTKDKMPISNPPKSKVKITAKKLEA